MIPNDPAHPKRSARMFHASAFSFVRMARAPAALVASASAAAAACAAGPLRRLAERLAPGPAQLRAAPLGTGPERGTPAGGLNLGEYAAGPGRAQRDPDSASAEVLFNGMFDKSADAQIIHVVKTDGTWCVERCNDLAARMIGLSADRVRGRRIEDLLPADTAAWTKADLKQAISTGEAVRRLIREPASHGSRSVSELIHVPIKDPVTGQVTRIFGTMRDVTHVRRADSEKSGTNRLLRMAESVAHVGHWRIEEPDGVAFWSEEVLRISGCDPRAGRHTIAGAIKAFHPDDRGLVEQQIQSARRSGVIDFTARLIRPDGEERNVLVRGFRQFTDATGGCSLFGVMMDVTELRRTEARLRDNAAMLKITLDNMDQGLIMVDPDGRVSICNQRARELLDLPAALMASQPRLGEVLAYQARHGEFDTLADDVRQCLEPSVPGGELYSYERTRPNGVVLDIRTAPLPAGGAVRTFTDVTTNRRAEQALRATEARYRLLADHASDLIVLCHSDGHRSYISPSVRALLGYTVEEAHGVGMQAWLHPDDLDRVFATTRALAPQDPERSVTFRLRHKDGSYVWVEAAFRRVEGENGAFTVITAIRDATERQMRTEELRMAKDAAESASRAKTDFLATMSHEIRTPLNSIIGFAELLATSDHLPPDLQRYADLVRLAGSALLTVVDDILDFSQVEAGAIELLAAPFDPATLIDNCLSIARGSAARKALVIDARRDPDIPGALVGDEGRLRQILLNLLNNAIKFTREGSITLTLRRERSSPDGETLRFCVTDTGIGISADKQHRLFQRFSQVDGSIRRDFGGTGLGLAICKRLVDLMGGQIGVVSDAGKGAMFWFSVTLPLGEDESAMVDPRKVAPVKRGRLLLVEDVEVNQELARLILELIGHRVDVVADGAAAVAAVQAGPYDLVLMDVQMPGMDGMTATQVIRRLPTPVSRIPIIAMTANVLPDRLRLIREAGMDGHVGKPIDRAELFSTIDRWLPEGGRPESPEGAGGPPPIFDSAVYQKLIELLGADTVARLAGKLQDELLARFIDLGDVCRDPAALMRETHATLPAAGMLGFFALSAACLSVHDHYRKPDTSTLAEVLAALRARRAEAILTLAGLRESETASRAPGGSPVAH